MAGMTALLEPFTGFVPDPDFAHRIVGPPAAQLLPDQREAARLDPFSFRHAVGRRANSPHEKARAWIRTCWEHGALRHVGPAVLVYRSGRGDLDATGIIADVSLSAYDSGLIRPHEATITKTERKMAAYMRRTRIFGNPVALAHRHHAGLSAAIEAATSREPEYSFDSVDGFSHTMWLIEGDEAVDVCRSFEDTLYITDGHHRLAAAALVTAEEGRLDPRLPAGVFAADELWLRSFARYVVDPELDPDGVIDRLGAEHRLEEVSASGFRPERRLEFGVKIGARTFRLAIDPDHAPDDLYRSLDVNLLQDLVLEPVFGISDPGRDERLHFVADLPNRPGLDLTFDAWFLPFPTSVAEVMAVADMGRTMPPKSTWFAPKLPAGLVIRWLDAEAHQEPMKQVR